MQWCKTHLAGYKCPCNVVFAEIPKTSTGKIQKFKLREMAKAGFKLKPTTSRYAERAQAMPRGKTNGRGGPGHHGLFGRISVRLNR